MSLTRQRKGLRQAVFVSDSAEVLGPALNPRSEFHFVNDAADVEHAANLCSDDSAPASDWEAALSYLALLNVHFFNINSDLI